MQRPAPQTFDRVLSSMCTEPHPAAREAAERFLATNPGDPATYTEIADLESEAVAVLGEIAGLGAATEGSGPDTERSHGYITSGGTEANLQAVRSARNRRGVTAPNVVVPESAHFSFTKAAEVLGVELRTVPTGPDRRVDTDAVAAAVDDDTVLIVGVAGTTEYGRVDPIPELAAIAHDAGAYCHVDAAWAGFLLPFTDHAWNFAHAPIDSLTIDPHKCGRAVVPAGGVLFRDAAGLDALAIDTPYLESRSQASLTGTRSGAGVASAVAAIEALWPGGYRWEYDRADRVARWLADELRDRGRPVVDVALPIVAADLGEGVVEALRDRGWRLARTDAGLARVVIMPHVTRATLQTFLEAFDDIR